MKFFVPKPVASTRKESQHAHECMRALAARTLGVKVKERRIFRIDFLDDGVLDSVSVGERERDSGELVAILETPRKYLICTPNHGGYQGKAFTVTKRRTESVTEFEE